MLGEMLNRVADVVNTGGGGGGDYVAKAVHFDGSTNINIPSLTSADPIHAVSYSAWFKISSANSYPTIFCGDPDAFSIWAALTSSSNQRAILHFQSNPGNSKVTAQSSGDVADDSWHHILASVVSDQDAFAPCGKIYVDDIDVTNGSSLSQGPFTSISNGRPFYAGTDTFGDDYTGDGADWWCGPGVSLLDGSFDIPEATRRLFRSALGKPVDPSGFPSGAVLFSGDATSFGTNQGTGGTFSVIGSLTNASTSPSD